MKYFTKNEVQKLVTATAGRPELSLMIEFAYRSGARRSEILLLCPGHFADGYVSIPTLKQKHGRPIRNVPIAPEFITRIVKIFPRDRTLRIWRMQCGQYSHLIKQAMDRAGFDKSDKRAWHAFRHGFAKVCLDESVDLRDLQRYLGHSNIAITSRYLSITEAYLTRLHTINFMPAKGPRQGQLFAIK